MDTAAALVQSIYMLHEPSFPVQTTPNSLFSASITAVPAVSLNNQVAPPPALIAGPSSFMTTTISTPSTDSTAATPTSPSAIPISDATTSTSTSTSPQTTLASRSTTLGPPVASSSPKPTETPASGSGVGSGSGTGLRPYQIFLVVFFGLASIPVSVAFFWCVGSLRKRNFEYSDEWSSSWWKRRALLLGGRPKATRVERVQAHARRLSVAVGNLVGLDLGSGGSDDDGGGGYDRHDIDASGTRSEQRGNGEEEKGEGDGGINGAAAAATAANSGNGDGDGFMTLETEVGRAWARPRSREDEPDVVIRVPKPVASAADARRDKRWSNFRVRMDDSGRRQKKERQEDTGYG